MEVEENAMVGREPASAASATWGRSENAESATSGHRSENARSADAIHHLAVGIGPSRATENLSEETKEAIRRIAGVRPLGSPGGPQVRFSGGEGFIQPADVATVLALLDLVARGDDLVAVLWLSLPHRVELELGHALKRARATPSGFKLIAHGRPTSVTLVAEALLELHMAMLRRRTPAQRSAIIARASHTTLAEAAASLGCSRQALSQAIARSGKATTDHTRPALLSIFALASADDPSL